MSLLADAASGSASRASACPESDSTLAYEFLLSHPPLGLSVQRQGGEFSLVTAPEVASSIERHLGNPRPVALSKAALEVLAIVAYRQPIARALRPITSRTSKFRR